MHLLLYNTCDLKRSKLQMKTRMPAYNQTLPRTEQNLQHPMIFREADPFSPFHCRDYASWRGKLVASHWSIRGTSLGHNPSTGNYWLSPLSWQSPVPAWLPLLPASLQPPFERLPSCSSSSLRTLPSSSPASPVIRKNHIKQSQKHT